MCCWWLCQDAATGEAINATVAALCRPCALPEEHTALLLSCVSACVIAPSSLLLTHDSLWALCQWIHALAAGPAVPTLLSQMAARTLEQVVRAALCSCYVLFHVCVCVCECA